MSAADRVRGFGRLLGSEMALVLGRRRNQAGMAVLAAVPIFMALVMRFSGESNTGLLAGNGLMVPTLALFAEAPFFLPLAVSMLAGDAIAGEAQQGTLRYLLTVPAGRTRLLAAKFCGLLISCLIGTALVAGVGIGLGVAFFGAGPTFSMSGGRLDFADALGRVLLMYLYYAVLLMAFATIGLFVSTLTEQPLGATVAIMIVNILGWIAISVPQLDWLHPWLLPEWMMSFTDLLSQPMHTSNVAKGLWLSMGYIVVFALAAWARFTRKDITS